MKLGTLIDSLDRQPAMPLPASFAPMEVTGISCRSDQVAAGKVFVAIEGLAADGHDYAAAAVENGAAAVVCQKPLDLPVPVIQVPNSRKALAEMAAAYYDHPSRDMTLIAITGTNGKTTTSYMVEAILATAGLSVGVIGTINYRFGGHSWDNPVTTPESVDLQQILERMRRAGITHVVMEVSSHGLDLYRIHGCRIDLAVFTNLSQDHLDYHGTMEAYWQAKRRLFSDYLLPDGLAVINIDDDHGRLLAESESISRLTCSQNDPTAAVLVEQASLTAGGIRALLRTPVGTIDLDSPLVGHHNLQNLACAVGVACGLKLSADVISSGIKTLKAVPGRLESVPNDHQRHVFVDYAHSPDALANVLSALRKLGARRLICVFGCGGDRDADKRPKMGRIATELADLVVVTSDNPRSENPRAIIEQILTGIEVTCRANCQTQNQRGRSCRCMVEPDRRKAIQLAISMSNPGDTILIAGKGHETYQIIGKTKVAFDDRTEAAKALDMLGSN